MSQRTRALVALVASVALLLGSGIAFALSQSGGVGEDLDRSVSFTPTPSPVPEDSADDDAPEAASQPPTGSADAAPEAPSPDDPAPTWATDETTRVDATEIVIPRAPEPPRQITIDSIGLSVPVLATGVQGDGQMEIPDNVAEMGWYEFGAAPGDDVGSAVIAGHVDSFEFGVGPLARLPEVAVGDRVVVEGPGPEPHVYEVTEATRYLKADLPTDVIFAPDVPHQLVVITCGGRYVGGTTGYEDNIVVVATPVDA